MSFIIVVFYVILFSCAYYLRLLRKPTGSSFHWVEQFNGDLKPEPYYDWAKKGHKEVYQFLRGLSFFGCNIIVCLLGKQLDILTFLILLLPGVIITEMIFRGILHYIKQ